MSKDLGDVAETKVIADLTELGYSVSIPYGDNNRYDLIVDDGDNLYRVQVKMASMKDGFIRFECRSCYTKSDGERVYNSYDDSEIDFYAVWSPDLDETYWISVSEAPSSAMRLRTNNDIDRVTSQTNWADEYKLK